LNGGGTKGKKKGGQETIGEGGKETPRWGVVANLIRAKARAKFRGRKKKKHQKRERPALENKSICLPVNSRWQVQWEKKKTHAEGGTMVGGGRKGIQRKKLSTVRREIKAPWPLWK